MYNFHFVETEPQERGRELMREAARDRLISEALAARRARRGRRTTQDQANTWLLPNVAAAAALLLAFFGQRGWAGGH